jgi:hypothetical protein
VLRALLLPPLGERGGGREGREERAREGGRETDKERKRLREALLARLSRLSHTHKHTHTHNTHTNTPPTRRQTCGQEGKELTEKVMRDTYIH